MVGRGGGREVRDLIGLYFAWLRVVEGERFYLRGRSNLLFMPFFFNLILCKNILFNVFKLYQTLLIPPVEGSQNLVMSWGNSLPSPP